MLFKIQLFCFAVLLLPSLSQQLGLEILLLKLVPKIVLSDISLLVVVNLPASGKSVCLSAFFFHS